MLYIDIQCIPSYTPRCFGPSFCLSAGDIIIGPFIIGAFHLHSGPETPSELLALAAERLGWCRLKLPWARPGSLSDGITVRLDLNRVEHLQCLTSLCRFSDHCQAAKACGARLGEIIASADLEPPSHSIIYSLSGDGVAFGLEPKGNALSQV